MIVILRTADTATRTSQSWIRPGQRLAVGRTYGDVLVPNDPLVSRSHFEISCAADGAWVRDLGSTTGTFLNGQQVVKSQLRHGDRIIAGQTRFVIEISGELVDQADQPRDAILAASPTPTPMAGRKKGLEIVNATPFGVARLFGRVRYPAHSMTVIVKGTFDLKPGVAAQIAEKQSLPAGDVPYPDDAEGHNAPRYPSDLAPFKPRADLLLVGHCHAPAGQYAGQVLATFKVGDRARTLRVSGKRYWQGVLATKPTDPRPFKMQPLRYEFAFGGALSPANPLGKGAIRVKDTLGAMRIPTPEIEDAARPMTKPTDRPPPAGFGPLRWDWAPRKQRMGVYGAKWLKERWPYYPADLDWRHFNVAPDELQLEGYLRGDEAIYLTNLHPQVAAYHTALPSLRVRAFVDHWDGSLTEQRLELDTLWIDADAEQLVLVWRGVVAVAAEEAPELRRLFVFAEPLNAPLQDCRGYYQQVLLEKGLVEAPTPTGETELEPAPGPTPEELLEKHRIAEAEVAQALAEMRAQLQAAGLDPENLPPAIQARVDQVLAGMPGAEPSQAVWTRESVAAHAAAKGSFAGERLSGLDLSGLDLSGLDFQGAEIIGADLAGAKLVQANLKGAQLIGSSLKSADLTGAILAEAYLVTALLQGARLVEADLAGAVLSGANLSEADLSRAKLPQADLNSADLTSANLAGANLTKARLSAANLTQANLAGAIGAEAQAAAVNLTGADLHGANFEKAHLAGAILAGANLCDADLSSADLSRCDARGIRGERVDLSRSKLADADLRQAVLTRANLMAALAPDCKWAGATLTDAKLGLAADFSRGDFREIIAPGSVWTAAQLAGAHFDYARLEAADFSEAQCHEASFQAANLRRARFRKSLLTAANLRQANLFEATMIKANLTGADASEANLFGAGLMEAQTAGLKTDRANLKRTLLASP